VLRGHDFYDYAAKYSDPDAVALTCPADLPAGIVEGVRTMAVQTFQALALEGLARVDFFYCPGGVGGARSELIVNEVNTMPGLTQFSMFPRSWAAAGLAYPDLIDELIQLALARPTGLR
jgi:D-alanine-D-alanine ligase